MFTCLYYGLSAVRLAGCFRISFTTPSYNVSDSLQYCHYVAGLVGVGLSRLFSASLLEDPEVGRDTELANSMGLFLQKTNIIRDYLEDQKEGRAFWPEEVSVVKYGSNWSLTDCGGPDRAYIDVCNGSLTIIIIYSEVQMFWKKYWN